MITKHITRYVTNYKASEKANLPVARVITDYTCSKIHFTCIKRFTKALSFIEKKAVCCNSHPVRPRYTLLGGFDKIQVDKRNNKIYLVKRAYKKRHDILVL